MEPGSAAGQTVRSVKSCPGYGCTRGQQDSVAVGLLLEETHNGRSTPGKVKMGVCACPSQCTETSFKDIGLVGTLEGWQIFVGGKGGTTPRIAELLAKDLSTEDALDLVDQILAYYRQNAQPRERIARMIQRLGLEHMRRTLGL